MARGRFDWRVLLAGDLGSIKFGDGRFKGGIDTPMGASRTHHHAIKDGPIWSRSGAINFGNRATLMSDCNYRKLSQTSSDFLWG